MISVDDDPARAVLAGYLLREQTRVASAVGQGVQLGQTQADRCRQAEAYRLMQPGQSWELGQLMVDDLEARSRQRTGQIY